MSKRNETRSTEISKSWITNCPQGKAPCKGGKLCTVNLSVRKTLDRECSLLQQLLSEKLAWKKLVLVTIFFVSNVWWYERDWYNSTFNKIRCKPRVWKSFQSFLSNVVYVYYDLSITSLLDFTVFFTDIRTEMLVQLIRYLQNYSR